MSWYDEKGHRLMDVSDLEKAKRSGRAYLKVSIGKRLPTVLELSMDSRWDKNGDLHAAYDLHLDGDADDQAFYQSEEEDGGRVDHGCWSPIDPDASFKKVMGRSSQQYVMTLRTNRARK